MAQIDQNDGGVMPFKKDETVMVPLRAVVEGFKGTYEEAGMTAKAELRGVVLEATVGEKIISVTEKGAVQTVHLPQPRHLPDILWRHRKRTTAS